MSVQQFPAPLYTKTLDSSEEALVAGFMPSKDQELAHIRLLIYKHGAHAGTEQLRLNLYTDSGYLNRHCQSSWLDLADISNLTSGNWYGFIRFDFAREFIKASFEFFLTVETQNYTRNASTFYLGLILDWPNNIYSSQSGGAVANAFELYGYRQMTDDDF